MTLTPDGPLFFKLCSDHLSIEAIPRAKLRVDLSKLKTGVDHFVVTIWTPHFMVMKGASGEEVTLRRDGRMIVRNSGSQAAAEAAAIRVLSLVTGL
jgi:hypothetical protein